MTDPDGRDWYEGDGGAMIWQKGDAQKISFDGKTYNHYGTSYNQSIGGGVSLNYGNSPNPESMTFNGMNGNNFVAQSSGTGCKTACDQMLSNEGVNSNGQRINIVNANANGVATTANGNAQSGIRAIDMAIENGNPIEVGVDYKPKQVNNLPPNGDGMTDHFIVVSGKTETLSNGQVTSKTYNFFDPRSSVNGTSSSNTLQLGNNKLTGHYLEGTPSSIPYTVTTVRRSR